MEQSSSLEIPLPEIDPEEQGARYWYERYCEQRAETERLNQRVKELEEQFETLTEKLRKLTGRTSETSSQPPSSDGPKKPNRNKQKPQRKRGPKYNHPGTTRNGFGWIDHSVLLDLQRCPVCGGVRWSGNLREPKRQQVAELVPKLVEVWEYERPLYQCPACGWQGYQDLPLGCREGFSYGGRLSSVVGWLGYGGNLSWSKQRYVVESIFGVPMSQGSLAKVHQWFCAALQPAYEQWWSWIQQPGVRCVDETSYRLNGVNHWIWIATATGMLCPVLCPHPQFSRGQDTLGRGLCRRPQQRLLVGLWPAIGGREAEVLGTPGAGIEGVNHFSLPRESGVRSPDLPHYPYGSPSPPGLSSGAAQFG